VIFGLFNQKLRDRIQDSMLNVTDHTFGIIFGIIRGIIVMGLIYWALLWYYSDASLPSYVTEARTRPVMQLTARKVHDWFIPGENKLLERDALSAEEAQKIYNNLISPAVEKKAEPPKEPADGADKNAEHMPEPAEIGYKDSERRALDNQIIQIESME
jgi:membrane protein required for colicin V production